MSRLTLVDNVAAMLQDAGFVASDYIVIRPKSFDLATRGDEDLLLLRMLGSIDAFDGVISSETRRLGPYLDATPLIVGLRTRNKDPRPGAVYFRHGMSVLDPDTAMDLSVEGAPSLIYTAPGGLYVSLDGDVLTEERQERGWSLGQFATELGASRCTASKYENGMNASIEMAIHLEELFGHPFSNPVDVLTGVEGVHDAELTPDDPDVDPDDERVLPVLTCVGFVVHPTACAPFKTVSEDVRRKKEMNVLTGHSSFTQSAEKRVQIMSSFGEITRTRSVYFIEEQQKRESAGDTDIVSCEEFAAIGDPDEVRGLIRERTCDPAES